MNSKSQALETPILESCKSSSWKRQFGNPTGALGAAVGHLMAFKNLGMNKLAVEMIRIEPDDQVLEVGFGHGKALQLAAARANSGKVCGVDISEVMVKQAARRNGRYVREGRVELRRGSVARLPYEDGRFTKVFAVNSFHHWPSPQGGLEEIRRVMKPGGLLLLCLRMKPRRKLLAPPGYTEDQIEAVKELLRHTGFRQVRSESRDLGGEAATCVMATR